MSRKDVDEWLLEIGAQMQRLSGELAPVGMVPARQKGWVPRIDVMELGSQVMVKVELAGVSADQVVIQLQPRQNSFVIRGERRDKAVPESAVCTAHQLEIEYGEFFREVSLPDVPLQLGRTRAGLSDGFLTIVIPKADEEPSIMVRTTVRIRKA